MKTVMYWIIGSVGVLGLLIIGFALMPKGQLKSTIDTGIFKALQKAASEVLNSKEGDDYIKTTNNISILICFFNIRS